MRNTVQAIPIMLLKPIAGVAGALASTLTGLRNEWDPQDE
jgi:hypothetical protein